jgi:hypothetical protein
MEPVDVGCNGPHGTTGGGELLRADELLLDSQEGLSSRNLVAWQRIVA